MATVSQEICDMRNKDVHKRVDILSDKVSKILGGVAVSAFVLIGVICGIFYHINYRFANVEKTLEKIEKKIEITNGR